MMCRNAPVVLSPSGICVVWPMETRDVSRGSPLHVEISSTPLYFFPIFGRGRGCGNSPPHFGKVNSLAVAQAKTVLVDEASGQANSLRRSNVAVAGKDSNHPEKRQGIFGVRVRRASSCGTDDCPENQRRSWGGGEVVAHSPLSSMVVNNVVTRRLQYTH